VAVPLTLGFRRWGGHGLRRGGGEREGNNPKLTMVNSFVLIRY